MATDNTSDGPLSLSTNPVHLGSGATSVPQPDFTGMDWYEEYGRRHGDDGIEGRLVSMHTFTESWDVWEVHPLGTEVVVVTSGTLTLIQEIDGDHVSVTLDAGQYVINEPGTWHTADIVDGPATALFITSGVGTDHRPRQD